MMDQHRPVTTIVYEYLQQNPVIRDCLSMDLVNLSALRRRICEEEDIDQPEAVLSALRRLRKQWPESSDASLVKAHLGDCRLEVRTGVGMLSFHPDWALLGQLAEKIDALGGAERIHLYHGWDALMVVGEDSVLDELVRISGRNPPFERESNLAELNVKTSDPLTEVPGFIAHISTSLARRGICIRDLSTCRRDHVFLISEEDLPGAIEALRVVIA